MMTLPIVVSIVVLVVLLAPFWVGEGGHLAPSATISSPDELEKTREAILQRYLQDEKAHNEGDLSALAWDKRKEFLTNRYIDATRRMDFLLNLRKEAAVKAVESTEEATDES